jgi:hypothetical protein
MSIRRQGSCKARPDLKREIVNMITIKSVHETRHTHDASAVPVPRAISLVTVSVNTTGFPLFQFCKRIVQKLEIEVKPSELRKFVASNIAINIVFVPWSHSPLVELLTLVV